MARVVGIVGRKNAGKTTLVVALCRALSADGRRVMTLKHGHHPALVDTSGTDTWRHFNEGGAERTVIQSPDQRILFERSKDDYDPVALVRRYLADADIVIVEGFSRSMLPRLEIWRQALQDPPLLSVATDQARWIGLVSDAPVDAPCPVIRLDGAHWVRQAADLAWQGATEVSA